MSDRIRCVMAWQTYRVGDVIQPPSNRRDILLGMRWAGRPYWVPHEEPASQPLPPTPEPEPEQPKPARRSRQPKAKTSEAQP